MPDQTLLKNTFISLICLLVVDIVFVRYLDVPLLYFFKINQDIPILTTVSTLLGTYFATTWWLIAGIIATGLGFFMGQSAQKPRTLPLFSWGVMVTGTWIITAVIKCILARYRPIELFSNDLYGFHLFSLKHDFTSMPSGHATLTFAGMFALLRLSKKPWLAPILLGFALIISLSRLIISAHYTSDVISGAYLGIVAVLWIEALLKKFYHQHPLKVIIPTEEIDQNGEKESSNSGE